jgi:putative oxidoreductase
MVMIKNNRIERFGPLLGRILIGAVYVANGIGLSTAFRSVSGMMADKGVPTPTLLLTLIILAWLLGGACIILGWQLRLAASVLFLLTIPVLAGIHGPWNADANAFQNELNHFLKGVAMLGGLACLAALGSGGGSLSQDRPTLVA